jgi:hypothetical protein
MSGVGFVLDHDGDVGDGVAEALRDRGERLVDEALEGAAAEARHRQTTC